VSHGISSYQFSAQNLSSPFSSKEAWKGVFLDLSIFKVFVLQHHIHKQVWKPSPPICIPFLFNWIELEIQFTFNSRCMQSHSIFSFEWNLISTKSLFYSSIDQIATHRVPLSGAKLMWTKGCGTKYILYTRHRESLGFWIYLKHRESLKSLCTSTTPTFGSSWSQWRVIATHHNHSWWRWLVFDTFVNDSYEVMAHSLSCYLHHCALDVEFYLQSHT